MTLSEALELAPPDVVDELNSITQRLKESRCEDFDLETKRSRIINSLQPLNKRWKKPEENPQ